MGDSAASTEVVTSEQVVKEEAATFESVSKTVHETEGFRIVGARVLSESGKVESSVTFPKTSLPNDTLANSTYNHDQSMAHSVSDGEQEHTVTSVETSHMEVSQESSVHVESVVEQTAEVSQQQQSVTHQEVSQTQSTTETAVSEAEETKAVEEPPPPPPPAAAAIESQPVDENANSIPDEPPVVEATPASEPEPAAEPIPEPAAEPEPAVAAAPEPAAEPAPEPAADPEPAVEAAPEPVAPAAAVDPIPEAEPKAEPAPEPVAEPEPAPAAPVAETKEETTTAEEISQENIKTQLHEIINEIEQEVQPEEEVDEDGTLQHTWRPKGKYDLQKTEILYEDVVPIKVPEVAITAEVTKPGPPPPVPSDTQDNQPQMMVAHVVSNDLDGLTNGGFVPDDLMPVEIPEGIPLLARVLPKTDQGLEGDKKISLERLFTPATDSGDLTPIKKKAFASSAFYRPDHPTIDDQVELAQRISFSLVDENNKMSRGQSMYMKRKKRSMRWVHQGEEGMEDYEGPGSGYEIMEEEPGHGPVRRPVSLPPLGDGEYAEKPPMKLLMSSKGVQDFQQVQEHYENLMNQTPPNPEVSKIVSEISSPTGKGAELFAKRKKRMDKFIVDETTVQKSQQTSMTSTSSSFSSSSSSSSQNVSSKKTFISKKQAEAERDKQQDQILEQFLKNRSASIVMVKSPWDAALETGCAADAFEDKRTKLQLAETLCERAETKASSVPRWLEMPKPVPVTSGVSIGTSAVAEGAGAIYTAEVKVVQRASLPPTPSDMPHHSLLELVNEEKSDKRKSASFNLAAKGWGTYNKFYTPVTFATKS